MVEQAEEGIWGPRGRREAYFVRRMIHDRRYPSKVRGAASAVAISGGGGGGGRWRRQRRGRWDLGRELEEFVIV